MKASQNNKKTAATYDSLSRWYDLISGPAEERAKRKAEELLNVRPGDRVLEIGSGTGSSALRMEMQAHESGFVFALDLSLKMLRVAQRKAYRKMERSQMNWICGDALQLPFAAHSVTKIFMSFTLELFSSEDMVLLLGECERVLSAGGRLAVLSMSRCQPKALLIPLYEWLHWRYPAFFDCRPILLRQVLEANDFRTLEARQGSIFGLPVESVLAELEPRSG